MSTSPSRSTAASAGSRQQLGSFVAAGARSSESQSTAKWVPAKNACQKSSASRSFSATSAIPRVRPSSQSAARATGARKPDVERWDARMSRCPGIARADGCRAAFQASARNASKSFQPSPSVRRVQ